MRPSARNRFAALALLSAAVLAAPGCGGTSDAEDGGKYRTIRTEPLRDTEAARQANQAGLAHLERGELEEAEAAFQRALTADVEFGPAHNNLGKVYFRRKDWYQAAWEFEYAAELMPTRAEPRNNLGLVHEQAKQLDQAVDQYREAMRLDPGDPVYRANLARALIRRGDRTDEVRDLLQQILEKDTRTKWLIWAQRQRVIMGG